MCHFCCFSEHVSIRCIFFTVPFAVVLVAVHTGIVTSMSASEMFFLNRRELIKLQLFLINGMLTNQWWHKKRNLSAKQIQWSKFLELQIGELHSIVC